MRTPLVAALSVALLALPLSAGAVTDDPDVGKVEPAVPDTTEQQLAEQALDEALALFEDVPAEEARERTLTRAPDATMLLNQVRRSRADLSPADRKRADALLARPTDGADDDFGDGYTVAEEPPVCGDWVCIHYVATTADRPPMADDDTSGLPDYVEDALATAEGIAADYDAAGYRAPDADDGRGGNDLVDIYLADIGDDGIYGYCWSDEKRAGAPWNRWAYCVVDDDYAARQFPANTPEENLRVTLAHEYFHAVQFAYDFSEDPWIMEATATWAEEQRFDAIDDNRFYLKYGQLRRPRLPLDEYQGGSLAPYGQWIFFQYLTERWTDETGDMPRIVLEMWRKMSGRTGAPDLHSTKAVDRVLSARNTSLKQVYGQFAAANRQPSRTYEEGRARQYKKAAPRQAFTLDRQRRTGSGRTTLDHLTHQTMRFRTGQGIDGRGWKLRVDVDLAGHASSPVARLVVKKENGDVVHRPIALSRSGEGRASAPFRGDTVKFVELVLVNASRRMDCWAGGGSANYSCNGSPRDDFRRAAFTGRLVRR